MNQLNALSNRVEYYGSSHNNSFFEPLKFGFCARWRLQLLLSQSRSCSRFRYKGELRPFFTVHIELNGGSYRILIRPGRGIIDVK
jgi:hypothetical protein